jgi:nicotinamide-nucleotide amidase
MPSVELLAVGTELLLGQLVDTNTPHVAAALAACGIDVYAAHTVGDNRARIAAAVRDALERADGVVTTGGLGPTVDDVTKEAVCDALDLDTVIHEPSLARMQELFGGFGREMRENNRKQARLPRGAHVLSNAEGSAPGFVAFDARGKFVACMPGVPSEMNPMLANELVPFLRERFHLHGGIVTRVLHTIGLAESEIDHRIDALFRTSENPKIAVLAHGGRCDVKVMAKAPTADEANALIAQLQPRIEELLAGSVYGRDEQTLPGAILAALEGAGRSVATAESCTGGRVAAELTSVPGSSRSYLGGVVAYDNAVKIARLGVPEQTLQKYGAVSEETARAMAQGVRDALHADVGIATTGVAGPGGGTTEKPVGLVWLAVATPEGAFARQVRYAGTRASVQARATTAALGLTWETVPENRPAGTNGMRPS